MPLAAFRPASPGRVRRGPLAAALVLALSAATLARALSAPALPAELSDAEFWRIVATFSEEGGTFPSNNYVSNETAYQTPLPALRARIRPGGVYLGVGPDQNFTYITALRPAVAFIVDIRRQNLLQHLLYKMLIELSPTREAFVSRLFSRPLADDVAPGAPVSALLAAVATASPDEMLFDRNLRDVLTRIERVHGFPLAPNDARTIEQVYHAFFFYGPEITYAPLPSGVMVVNGTAVQSLSPFPSYADLVARTDAAGVSRSYLSTPAAYAALRDLHLRNLIVPLVGDFAGDRTLRMIGDWVRGHEAVVSVFYASNVEQYLFQHDTWRAFYANVATLPLDDSSTFVRAFFPTGAVLLGGARLIPAPGRASSAIPTPSPTIAPRFVESSTLTGSIRALLGAVAAGEVTTYQDVIARSR